jgi:hypothetical protein
VWEFKGRAGETGVEKVLCDRGVLFNGHSLRCWCGMFGVGSMFGRG